MKPEARPALLTALLLSAPLIAQRTTFTAVSPGCYAVGAPSVRYPGTGGPGIQPGIYWTQHDPYLDLLAGGSNPARLRIVLLSLQQAPAPLPLPFPSYWGCQLHVPPDVVLLDPTWFTPIVGYQPGFRFYVQGVEYWSGDNGTGAVYPAYASVTTAWRVDI